MRTAPVALVSTGFRHIQAILSLVTVLVRFPVPIGMQCKFYFCHSVIVVGGEGGRGASQNAGPVKCKTWKMTDQIAGLENASFSGPAFSSYCYFVIRHFLVVQIQRLQLQTDMLFGCITYIRSLLKVGPYICYIVSVKLIRYRHFYESDVYFVLDYISIGMSSS